MSKKIHIALLADCLENFAGGAEKQIYELAKGLDKSKYRVSVLSLDCQGQASSQAIEAIGCQLYVFRVKRIYGLSGLYQGIKFYSFLRNTRVDILQTYHFSSDIWGTIWGRLAGVPCIVSNRRDMGFWRSNIHVQAYRLVNRWVNRVVVVANAVKNMVIATEGVAAQKIVVIYNGIDISAVSGQQPEINKRQELGIKEGDKIIVHVANLKPVKGHVYLFEALAQVVQDFPHVKLLLIGKDELGGSLQRLAQELKIADNVVFLGRRTDVAELLSLADFCILPSLSEGMSNAILEYMVAGKAVIATAVGGNMELVVPGETGQIVEKGNVSQLARSIMEFLINPALARTMGERGLARAKEFFSLQKMVKEYEYLLDHLLPVQKNILHLISSGGFFGAERVLLSIAECFGKNGFNVCVGALQDERNPHLEVVAEAQKKGLPTFVLESRGRFDLGTIFSLRRYIKENNVSILHTHNYKSDLTGLAAAKLSGIPIVATAHGFTDMDRRVGAYETLDRMALKMFFHKVVLMTDKMLENIPSHKKKVIPNGINTEKFSGNKALRGAVRQKWGLSDEIVIGTVGRLSVEKNQALLIAAFKDLPHAHRRFKLMIVGDGPQMKALKDLAAGYGLAEKIIFTGLVRDTSSVYAAFDIFVLSSLTEGVPLTILEAMASGVPIVSTAVGAIPGMVKDDKTGYLVPSGDTVALTEKLSQLSQDAGLRERIRQNALLHVNENYTLERMCREYRKIYEEVLN